MDGDTRTARFHGRRRLAYRDRVMSHDVLTRRQINRATLARQMLLGREAVSPVAAIERLVAMQAQWPRPPFIGLWSRLKAFDRAQLSAAFERRTVVRATFLRGTIHAVSARDFVALRPAVQPALDAGMRGILRNRLHGVDLTRLTARARKVLSEQPAPFEALRDRFLRDDPAADERAMGYAVRMLLPLVQVPVKDAAWAFPAQACFALADEWLGREIAREPAPPDVLIERYLAAYGPASAAAVQAWSGLAGPAVRAGLQRLAPRLRRFRDEDGRELFDVEAGARPPGDVGAPVRFVPEFDNLIATRADERFVARAHRPRVFLSALRIAATVLVDGFVAATWKLQPAKNAVTIIVEPFTRLSAQVRQEIGAEAEAVARFAEPAASRVRVKL
jgi:winged helix DNA-binding protein